MKRTVIGAILVALTALSLSGCWEAEAEQKPKEQKPKEQKEVSDNQWNITTPDEEQKSKDFFDMGGPTDRSKSKGYVP